MNKTLQFYIGFLLLCLSVSGAYASVQKVSENSQTETEFFARFNEAVDKGITNKRQYTVCAASFTGQKKDKIEFGCMYKKGGVVQSTMMILPLNDKTREKLERFGFRFEENLAGVEHISLFPIDIVW